MFAKRLSIACLLISACNNFDSKSDFGSRKQITAADQTPVQTLVVPKEDDVNIDTPVKVVDGKIQIQIDPANLDLIRGRNSEYPASIYFALDVTGSMQSVITAVKENIKLFAEKLSTKKIGMKFGVVAFRDEIAGVFPLTDNLESFKTFLNSQTASGGNDAWEAALLATDTAFQKIQMEDTRPGSLKSVLTITDNVGHHGAPAISGMRDCSITQTVALLNSIPADQQKNYRLFHSTATVGKACGTYAAPVLQFDDILSKVFLGQAQKDRGSSIAWPFTSDTMLTELSSKIQENFPDINSACLAKEAHAFIDNKEVGSWSDPNLDNTFGEFETSKPILFEAKNISKSDIGKEGKMTVVRCCINVDKFKSGESKECLHEKIQKVSFKLK